MIYLRIWEQSDAGNAERAIEISLKPFTKHKTCDSLDDISFYAINFCDCASGSTGAGFG